MPIELIAVNVVLFVTLAWAIVRRMGMERHLQKEVASATGELKGKAGERVQTQTFQEQLVIQVNRKRADLARTEKRILMLETEIRKLEEIDYRIVHALGEPSKDMQLFTCALLPNPHAEKAQRLSALLEKADHIAFISAESDATAKRLLQVQFPDRGPLRPTAVTMVADK